MSRLSDLNSYESDITNKKYSNKHKKINDPANIPNKNRSKSRSPIRKSDKNINQSQESSRKFINHDDKDFMEHNEQDFTIKPDDYSAAPPPGLCSSVVQPLPLIYGPCLPPTPVSPPAEALNSKVYGPALPSSYSIPNSDSDVGITSKIYGPAFPSNVIDATRKKTSHEDNYKKEELHRHDSADDGEYYGPMPSNYTSNSEVHIALEERALQLKLDYLQDNKKGRITREIWMTELPDAQTKNFGLGPRQFRPTPAPDLSDRSSWTDTPEDKIKKELGIYTKKVDLEQEAKIKHQKKYDYEQKKAVDKYKKVSSKAQSLLEIHQSNLNKKKKGEEHTRRPFNREIDLNVNQFDAAQKKAILKKAELLNDRFASGQSKFL